MLCSDLYSKFFGFYLHLAIVKKKKSQILSSENYGKPDDSNFQFINL